MEYSQRISWLVSKIYIFIFIHFSLSSVQCFPPAVFSQASISILSQWSKLSDQTTPVHPRQILFQSIHHQPSSWPQFPSSSRHSTPRSMSGTSSPQSTSPRKLPMEANSHIMSCLSAGGTSFTLTPQTKANHWRTNWTSPYMFHTLHGHHHHHQKEYCNWIDT